MERRPWVIFAMGGLAGASLAYVCCNHWKSGWTKAMLKDAQAAPGTRQESLEQSKTRPEDFVEDEIVKEHLTRNIQFFGQEGQLQISKAFVVVVGLGVRSVGGSCWWMFWDFLHLEPSTTAYDL